MINLWQVNRHEEGEDEGLRDEFCVNGLGLVGRAFWGKIIMNKFHHIGEHYHHIFKKIIQL